MMEEQTKQHLQALLALIDKLSNKAIDPKVFVALVNDWMVDETIAWDEIQTNEVLFDEIVDSFHTQVNLYVGDPELRATYIGYFGEDVLLQKAVKVRDVVTQYIESHQ